MRAIWVWVPLSFGRFEKNSFEIHGGGAAGGGGLHMQSLFAGVELHGADGEFLEDLRVSGHLRLAGEDRFAGFDEEGQIFTGARGGVTERNLV